MKAAEPELHGNLTQAQDLDVSNFLLMAVICSRCLCSYAYQNVKFLRAAGLFRNFLVGTLLKLFCFMISYFL